MFSSLLETAKNSPFSSPTKPAQCLRINGNPVNMAASPSGILYLYIILCVVMIS